MTRVQGDKSGVAVAWRKLFVLVEVDAHRRRMRRHQGRRWSHALYPQRIVLSKRQNFIPVTRNRKVDPLLIAVGKRDTVKTAVANDIDPLRRCGDALDIMPVIRAPKRAGDRMQRHTDNIAYASGKHPTAAAIEIELQN